MYGSSSFSIILDFSSGIVIVTTKIHLVKLSVEGEEEGLSCTQQYCVMVRCPQDQCDACLGFFTALVLMLCSVGVIYHAEMICSDRTQVDTLHYFVIVRCAAQHLMSLVLIRHMVLFHKVLNISVAGLVAHSDIGTRRQWMHGARSSRTAP